MDRGRDQVRFHRSGSPRGSGSGTFDGGGSGVRGVIRGTGLLKPPGQLPAGAL
jgi:hypothetical protein